MLDLPFAPASLTWVTEDEWGHDWWETTQPLPGYLDAFDALLPRLKGWSPKVLQWGSADGNRIDVTQENGRTTDILVRIDLRSPDEGFIAGIASLAEDLGCDFLSREGLLATGDAAHLAVVIRNSPAMRFVADPMAFLRRIGFGGYKDA